MLSSFIKRSLKLNTNCNFSCPFTVFFSSTLLKRTYFHTRVKTEKFSMLSMLLKKLGVSIYKYVVTYIHGVCQNGTDVATSKSVFFQSVTHVQSYFENSSYRNIKILCSFRKQIWFWENIVVEEVTPIEKRIYVSQLLVASPSQYLRQYVSGLCLSA